MYPDGFTQGYRVDVTARRKPGNPDPGINHLQSDPAAPRAQQLRPHRGTLKYEISIALAAKLVLLFALWLTFFNHPLDRSLNSTDMDRVLLGPTANSPSAVAHATASTMSKDPRHDP
jgi:hypothetical protein